MIDCLHYCSGMCRGTNQFCSYSYMPNHKHPSTCPAFIDIRCSSHKPKEGETCPACHKLLPNRVQYINIHKQDCCSHKCATIIEE